MQDALCNMTFTRPDTAWPKPMPDNAGKVSVVMRTKDRPLLVKRACETVLAQTYTDWSLIIVNDGGPAQELEACLAQYRQLFEDRLAVVHNPVCLGRAKSANIGLQAAVGEFVAFLDDDDTWAPVFLKDNVTHLRTPGNEHLGGVVSHVRLIKERIENGTIVLEKEMDHNCGMAAVCFDKLLAQDHIPLCSLLFRRAVLDVLGSLNEALWTLCDWDFLTRLSCMCEIGVVPKPLAHRHRRTNLLGTPYANSQDSDMRRKEEALVRNQAIRRFLADASHPVGGFLAGNHRLQEVLREVEHHKRELAGLRAAMVRQEDLRGIEQRLQVLEQLVVSQERFGQHLEALAHMVSENARILERNSALLENLFQQINQRPGLLEDTFVKVGELHLWLGILTWPLRAVWRPIRRVALHFVGRGSGHAS